MRLIAYGELENMLLHQRQLASDPSPVWGLEGVIAILDEDAKTSSFKKVPLGLADWHNCVRISTISTIGS